jgi:hypothetical protein
LLERERTLKELAAVQAAAEDEVAFEQRTAVAKNFQDFVLCHELEFQVSGFKFQVNPQMAQIIPMDSFAL